jgi:hypothetical protein
MSIPSDKHGSRERRIWTALFQVRASGGSGILKGALGAFVPAVALARDAQEATSLISEKLESYDLETVDFEDVEPLEIRKKRMHVPETMLNLAESITPENPVAFGGFHSYKHDPKNG